MNSVISPQQKTAVKKATPERPVFTEKHNLMPSVSVVQSFQPKMSSKSEIDQRLKAAAAKVEKELMDRYPSEIALPVVLRLRRILGDLNYNTHKISIAIFVSPVTESITYMDIPVQNKVVIDDDFCIRDLVRSKQQDTRYMVLQLGEHWSKTYLGEGTEIRLIKANTSSKDLSQEAFLHRMEHGLSLLLLAYPVPVFVMGAPHVTGLFSTITKHPADIVGYIRKDLPDAKKNDLLQLLEPNLSDWRKVRETKTLHHVENARSSGKLVCGIKDIEEIAHRRNSRLLVVEKGLQSPDLPATVLSPFYLRDTVDLLMQKVLENGGDVEFVEDGQLSACGGIALVRYY